MKFFSYEIKLLISTHYEMTRRLEVRMTQGMKRSAVQNTVCELQLIVAQCDAQLPHCYTRGDPQRATTDNHTHLPSSPRFTPTLLSYPLVDLSSTLSPWSFPIIILCAFMLPPALAACPLLILRSWIPYS